MDTSVEATNGNNVAFGLWSTVPTWDDWCVVLVQNVAVQDRLAPQRSFAELDSGREPRRVSCRWVGEVSLHVPAHKQNWK